METWHFGIDNDQLIELVLSGKKTATTSLYSLDNLPEIGKQSILIYDNEKKACITETKEIIIKKFKDITLDLASLEGETNSLEEWKESHKKYFSTITSNFNEDTEVVFEIFIVVENLVLKRLKNAKKIVNSNKNIFGDNINIKEINAGFNNSIFDVNNKYIIKICDNKEIEQKFEVESEFYISNKNSKAIPKLYKFDNSKDIVPYLYEIIEKIDGKSVYYYWYKMDENDREKFIKELIDIIRTIHNKTVDSYDWCNYVKNKVLKNYNETKKLFLKCEQDIIVHSLNLYDIILTDNRFSLIHNDLHFDNILIDNNKKIKLIDFNDAIIAPFDYDLRIFYICIEQPWKWANIEMDPFQKPDDYKNIFKYIKKYYSELNDINYLEERMIIYSILNDIDNLPKYKKLELKNRIVNNSKLLIKRMNND